MFEKQGWHLLWLVLLTAGAWWTTRDPRVIAGEWGGLTTRTWFWIAVATPIAHQIYVWLAWRLQLPGKRLTRALGSAAFPLYAVGFAILFLGRFGVLIALARSNEGSVENWQPTLNWIALAISIPAVYTLYSVARYFGVLRAFGQDHFDPNARTRGLVRKGAFRFVPNAMYVFGLLALWLPGLLAASASALVVALFSHIYIWVHYYCTERPDMRRIYG